MAYTLNVNGKTYSNINVPENMPLLWVIRDIIGLTGTKYGCGIEKCYACTILIDGEEKHSCVVNITEGVGRKITTIEGLSANNDHPLQKAWVEHQVPQCGYCQSGQIMAAAALLATKPRPTDADIDTALNMHICRCGTYERIRRAIHRAAASAQTESGR